VLHRANLDHVDATRASLARADLERASLNNGVLVGADLKDACLDNATAEGANLERACLQRAHLSGCNITGANLGRVIAQDAHLDAVTGIGVDFTEANFNRANLACACLHAGILERTSLIDADLQGADLRMSKMVHAVLQGADLSQALMDHVKLTGADLRWCRLYGANLTRADITGAALHGIAKEGWKIAGIECRYVYLDAERRSRFPKDRDFSAGEFERLYRNAPIIEYVFRNGMSPMDPLIMERVVQAIRDQNPEYDIEIDSISVRGLAPSIKFTVQKEEHRDAALAEVTKVYEAKVHELAGRLDETRSFIQLLIDRPNSVHIQNPRGPLAIGGSTINIDKYVEYITSLRDAVAALPEDSPTFAKVAKKTALGIIGDTLKDVAKGQIKEAAKQIYELGKEFGPVVLSSAAYAALKGGI
jgi:hypothetical protein